MQDATDSPSIKTVSTMGFIIASFLLIVYWPTITIPYVHQDSYNFTFWTSWHHEKWCYTDWMGIHGFSFGRPLNGFISCVLSDFAENFADFYIFRLTELLAVAGSAILVALVLFSAFRDWVPATLISLILFTLPSMQVTIGWAMMRGGAACFLSVISALFLMKALSNELSRLKVYLYLLIAAGFQIVALNIYQTYGMYIAIVFLAWILFSDEFMGRKFDQEAGKRLSIWVVGFIVVSSILYYIFVRFGLYPFVANIWPDVADFDSRRSFVLSSEGESISQIVTEHINHLSWLKNVILPRLSASWISPALQEFVPGGHLRLAYWLILGLGIGASIVTLVWKHWREKGQVAKGIRLLVIRIGLMVAVMGLAVGPLILKKTYISGERVYVIMSAIATLAVLWAFREILILFLRLAVNSLLDISYMSALVRPKVLDGTLSHVHVVYPNAAFDSFGRHISYAGEFGHRLVGHPHTVALVSIYGIDPEFNWENVKFTKSEWNEPIPDLPPDAVVVDYRNIVARPLPQQGRDTRLKNLGVVGISKAEWDAKKGVHSQGATPPGSAPGTSSGDQTARIFKKRRIHESKIKASEVTGQYTADRAFDGSVGTTSFWEVRAHLPLWVDIDFEKPTSVFSYVIASQAWGEERYPRTWELLGSDDAETWIRVDFRKMSAPWRKNERKHFEIKSPDSYRYYRFKVHEGFDSVLLRIYEITFEIAEE